MKKTRLRPRFTAPALALWTATLCAAPGSSAAQQTRSIRVEPAAPLTAAEQTVIGVTQRVSPAVVGVRTRGGAGSGFIIRSDGVLLTNAHVVGNSRMVTVELATGAEVQGTVLGLDVGLDIAVVDIPGNDLPVAPLADSDRLVVGQSAIAIGNPLGLQRTVTTGIISAIRRDLNLGSPVQDELIQTDAAINPGNSGGPLLNSAGQVIGINTLVLGSGGRGISPVGLGFAVPINLARDIAEQVVTTGQIRRTYLGIDPRDIEPEMARQFGLPVREGIIVVGVIRGTPAERAGLREGDMITRIDSTPIRNSGDLRRVLRERRPNETVTVSGVRLRPSESFSVKVQLGQVTISERPG